MTDKTKKPEALDEDELAKANGERIPDREQMSAITMPFMPVAPVDEIQPIPVDEV